MKIGNQHTVAEIALFLGAKFVGNGEQIVTGLNEIHRVEQGDLAFVDHPKYYDKVLKSAKKGTMNPPQLLQQVDLIAAEYNVKDDEISKDVAAKFAKPQLILSESFK